MNVYLIEGSSGEYSSYSTWIVEGYLNENNALTKAEEMQKESNKTRHEYDKEYYQVLTVEIKDSPED